VPHHIRYFIVSSVLSLSSRLDDELGGHRWTAQPDPGLVTLWP
jgi:hypothetical protein